MLKITYPAKDGQTVTVEYDPNYPCEICGFPIREPSMGGVTICPWCDSGSERPETTKAKKEIWANLANNKILADVSEPSPEEVQMWIEGWWKYDKKWRDKQREILGPDDAQMLRGIAESIEERL